MEWSRQCLEPRVLAAHQVFYPQVLTMLLLRWCLARQSLRGALALLAALHVLRVTLNLDGHGVEIELPPEAVPSHLQHSLGVSILGWKERNRGCWAHVYPWGTDSGTRDTRGCPTSCKPKSLTLSHLLTPSHLYKGFDHPKQGLSYLSP